MFLLFLDCVWQLVHQHPPAFDFTETYLTVLSDSLYIPIFSTFFFNSPHQKDNVVRVPLRNLCLKEALIHEFIAIVLMIKIFIEHYILGPVLSAFWVLVIVTASCGGYIIIPEEPRH